MLLNEAIDTFQYYIKTETKPGTVHFYQYYLKKLKHDLGHIECEKITTHIFVKYLNDRKEENPLVSNATLNKHIITLKRVLKRVCDIKFKYDKFKEQKKNIVIVSPKSSDLIFNYYQKNMSNKYNFRNYLFLKILLDTGLRLSEIANIRIDNIDIESGLILVTVTKTDVDRYVVLTEPVRKLLYKFIITQPLESYLFTDFKEDKPLSTSSIECFIYRLRKRLGIKGSISPHKWRHSFATSFNKKGGNLETLRMLLGHANIKTTQRYLHLDKDDILKEYRKIMG